MTRLHLALCVVLTAWLALQTAASLGVPPHFVVDMALEPEDRWNGSVGAILSVHSWSDSFGAVFAYHNHSLFDHLSREQLSALETAVLKFYPTEARELTSLSREFSRCGHFVSTAYLAAWVWMHELGHTTIQANQLAPSFPLGCTGVVVQPSSGGSPYHGRNMDQHPAAARNLTLRISFVNGSTLLLEAVDFYWFTSGVVTAVRKDCLSVQENWRVSDPPLTFDQVFSHIREGAVPQVFVFRRLLGSVAPPLFKDCVASLSTTHLAAPYYVVAAGPHANEGVIITRNATAAVNVVTLSDSRWFLVQTNHEPWLPDPPKDPRRTVAENLLKAMGQTSGATQVGTFAAVSQYPVHNTLTVYTAVMSPEEGLLGGFVQEALRPVK